MASYQSVVLGDSPLGYWRLDETSGTTAADLGSGNQAGTYVNTPTLGVTTLAPDGTGTAVTTTTAQQEDITLPFTSGFTTTGTVEFWFKWTSGSALFRDNTSAAPCWVAFDNGGTLAVRAGHTTTLNTTVSTASLRDGAAHHFVLVKNAGNVSVYIDSVLVINNVSAGGNTAAASPWHFGRNGIVSPGEWTTATYDEVATYSTALDSATVTEHYRSGNANIERAATVYLRNDFTIDTGTGIDIRLLASHNGGTNDASQTTTATHTQVGLTRTFDPATAGSNANNDPRSGADLGWALRLFHDQTPSDDTNCNVRIPAGNASVHLDVTVNQAGGTYVLATWTPIFMAALYKWNAGTNTGTVISSGAVDQGGGNVPQQWTVGTGADLGTYKTVTVIIPIAADVEIAQDEILLLQVGHSTSGMPQPTLGTATWTITLRLNNNTTRMVYAGARQVCSLTDTVTGSGVTTQSPSTLAMERSVTGDGVTDYTRAALISKTFDVAGDGIVAHTKNVGIERTAAGDGVAAMTRIVAANKSFTVLGDGAVSRTIAAALARSTSGDGVATSTKTTVASKAFTVTGDGTITELHPVQAYRTFNLVGEGFVPTNGPNGSSITVPLDELPTPEGGTVVQRTDIYVFDD